MNQENSQTESTSGSPWLWIIAGTVVALLIVLLARRPGAGQNSVALTNSEKGGFTFAGTISSQDAGSRSPRHRATSDAPSAAEEIVARKFAEFSKRRRALVHAIAKHFNVEVPSDVERFFAAVDSGKWEEIDAAHEALLMPGQGFNQPRSAELHKIWRAIQETWGIAREAHTWPAQTLLDYGQAALGSLRPGMVYVGGTDPGCFVPTFLKHSTIEVWCS